MRLRLYCNRYGHFKDALVCSVSCAYRTRCGDFALFYDDNRAETDALVEDYLERQRSGERAASALSAAAVNTNSLVRLEVKREMAEAAYIWIGADDRAELIETEEVLRRAERGAKAKHIYRVAQEMELRYQLVPRKRIEKARRAADVEAERAAARRSRLRPVPVVATEKSVAVTSLSNESPAAVSSSTTAAPRRRVRARSTKIAGGR
ncbi:MAG: hypothetical protein H0V88_05485 [Pyrinomonadaceae bacterium]|nr:hypothetical protein [Pyrinomonadaceae bacterium]